MPSVYLDCNATTPLDPGVRREVRRYLEEEFGNAASPVHEYGSWARMSVERARRQVAALASARPEEVIFTSGATESNNLAILGLAAHGEATGHRHLIGTAIEHKSVLEPLAELAKRGFEVTLVPADTGGRVEVEAVRNALRPDTLLVTLMQANNETGILQPLAEVADLLADHPAYLHTDAAQGFGKELTSLHHSRIDLISISGHKIFAPKGIGCLLARRRGADLPPLSPLMFGGGQEQGLRPGTLPVPLIVGLGAAAALAVEQHQERQNACREYRQKVMAALAPLGPQLNGDQRHCLPHTLNLRFPGIEAVTAMQALKDLIAVSSGSACTAHTLEPSHVLRAMGMPEETVRESFRLAWCHLTEDADWNGVLNILQTLSR